MAQWNLRNDEPWIFLDDNKNPVHGRRLTFRGGDGTVVQVEVSMQEYADTDLIKERLTEAANAHTNIAQGFEIE